MLKYQKAAKVVLGIPITFTNEVHHKADFSFERQELLNKFGHIKTLSVPSDNLIIRIDVDLLLILSIVEFFSIKDMISKLGGYKATLDIFLVMFIPFFVLSYLYKLARIIKQTRMKQYLGRLKDIAFPLYNRLYLDKQL